MSLKVLSRDEIFGPKPAWREPGGAGYLAMYSSVFGGVVTDPALMVMPVDDHVINRGDGIFEYFPVWNGHAYCFQSHMTRLRRSAEIISLNLPFDIDTIGKIVLETIAISGAKQCGLRIFVTRGIGDFSVSPTSPKKSELYVVVLSKTAEEQFPKHWFTEGASLITAHVPMKPGFYAQVKSTDYVLNALVALEATRMGADFGVWLEPDGYMAEPTTETVAIGSQDGVFKYPPFLHTLRGTGLLRGIQLAEELVKNGTLKGICQTNIAQQEVYEASELYLLSSGTTIPIVKFDGRPVGSGQPGPVFHALDKLFKKDMFEGPAEARTPIPYKK
jgi:branched-chain amino acid aminotransferase